MSDPNGARTYSSTFPAALPSDLSDPAAIARHDQAAFHALDELLCHWDRPHRPSYHWLVQVGDDPAAVDLAARCQRYLPSEGLDPIPGPWIHLTVDKAGYEDELSPQALEDLVEDVAGRVRRVPRFSLQLIPLAGSPGAVRLSVAPWTSLMELFDAVGRGRADRKSEEIFRPHVGVAYSSARQRPGLIAEATQRASEELSSIEVQVTGLSLVRLWRAAAWYEWQELEFLALD